MNPIIRKYKSFMAGLEPARQDKSVNTFSIAIKSLIYKRRYGLHNEYVNFEFEKHDKAYFDSFLHFKKQKEYLGILNPIKYYSLARNKYLGHLVLEAAGIRKATLFCYYDPFQRVENNDRIGYDLQTVTNILKAKNVQKSVFKTTESSHGEGVFPVVSIDYSSNDPILTLKNGATKPLSATLGTDPLIIESIISQTEQMNSFNKSSVNTVRFMTTLMPDGTAKVIATFIKIGVGGAFVDNAGAGGNVDAGVDVQNGQLYNTIYFKGWRNYDSITHHPENGTAIEGVKIENWEAIKAQVIKFQQAMPFVRACGWDIAITDEGPLVIEFNDFWDRTGQMFIGKGWRKEIEECYNAWKELETKGVISVSLGSRK